MRVTVGLPLDAITSTAVVQPKLYGLRCKHIALLCVDDDLVTGTSDPNNGIIRHRHRYAPKGQRSHPDLDLVSQHIDRLPF